MSRPTVKFFDAVSQEEIIREMNDEEYAIHLTLVKKVEDDLAKLDEAQAAKAAAEAKLAALGLTTDDLKALGLN
jgi:hypothetical protein